MAAVVAASVLPAAAPALAEPVVAPTVAAASTERLSAELEFRRQVGFDHAPARVAALHTAARSGWLPAVDQDGMLFTPAEAAELHARQAAGAQINAAVRRLLAEPLPEVFAGVYLDHAAGGVMTVQVTRDAARHAAALRRGVDDPRRLRVVTVAHSEQALTRAQERLARTGVDVAYSAVDVERNRLVVGLGSPDPAVRTAVGRAVPADMLIVDEGTRAELAVCATGLSCSIESPPFDGGTDMESFDADLGGVSFCTLGFVARSAAGSSPHVLSAGHCGPTLSSWVQQSTPIGVVADNRFRGTTRADVLTIPVSAALARGWVKRGPGRFLPVRYQERAVEDYVGKVSCAYGIRTGYRCGKIVTRTMRATFGGVTLVSQRVAARPCGPGDSGGPTYYSYRAQGLTSFSLTRSDGARFCGYSHIGHVLSSVGLATVVAR